MAKRNMNVKERRKYPRIRVRLAVSILAADGLRQGKMEDISLGGAFISCEKPPRPNEKVLLNYRDHSKKMQVIAQVAWTNHESEGSRDKPAGVGVKFLQFLNNQRSTER
jgi:Tfp pilus assembly protein PilZ